ncbi:unnamed protein product [Prunus brigantina]
MLALAQRPRWLQSDLIKERTYSVTDVAMILLVVGHEFGGPLHVSVVEFVMEQPVHHHHHRLLHLIGNHHTRHRLHFSVSQTLLHFQRLYFTLLLSIRV